MHFEVYWCLGALGERGHIDVHTVECVESREATIILSSPL